MSPVPAGLIIRPFQPSDQDAVRRLVLAGLSEHFGAVDEARNPDLDDIARHYLAAGHSFVVAELDGALAGAGALVREAPRTGRLARMSVRSDLRRQGIGCALARHLVGLARERGDTRLLVETTRTWDDAIALYRGCGFMPFAWTADEIHLAMDLPAH